MQGEVAVLAQKREGDQFSALDWRLILSAGCVLYALAVWGASEIAWILSGNTLAKMSLSSKLFQPLYAFWMGLSNSWFIVIWATSFEIVFVNLDWSQTIRLATSIKRISLLAFIMLSMSVVVELLRARHPDLPFEGVDAAGYEDWISFHDDRSQTADLISMLFQVTIYSAMFVLSINVVRGLIDRVSRIIYASCSIFIAAALTWGFASLSAGYLVPEIRTRPVLPSYSRAVWLGVEDYAKLAQPAFLDALQGVENLAKAYIQRRPEMPGELRRAESFLRQTADGKLVPAGRLEHRALLVFFSDEFVTTVLADLPSAFGFRPISWVVGTDYLFHNTNIMEVSILVAIYRLLILVLVAPTLLALLSMAFRRTNLR